MPENPERQSEPGPPAPLSVARAAGLARRKYTQPQVRVVAFKLAGYEYVIDVAQVQEIVRPGDLVTIGGVPDYIVGLVKRRGRIVPVVELRQQLGLPAGEHTPETCVIIVKLAQGPVGLVVDSASELMWIKPRDFEVPSPIIAGARQGYLLGVAHLGDRALVLLDPESIFDAGERAVLGELGQGD